MKSSSNARPRVTTLASVILLVSGLAACGGGHGGGPPIQVAVSADQTTIDPGATAQVTATVLNDTANRGVTWSLSCSAASCGAVSPVATAAGVSTTYTAPATRPPADLTVTITAKSASNPDVAADTKVTVAGGIAISVALSGDSTVPAGTTTQISATVVNDPANGGVTWTVSCATAPCGKISPVATSSGAATTYSAPVTPPLTDLTVTLTATGVSNAAISASAAITVPGIQVAVSPAMATNVTAGTTVQFSATVNYDPANQGVSWTLQCSASDCGAVSPLTSASGASVTYTAPAAPPPRDLQVTLWARSVSAPSVQGSASIGVRAVAVSITPVSALVPLNVAQQFVGAVGFDPSANSIAWQLTQNGTACLIACGIIAPAMTANGGAITYTAPASLPLNKTVTLRATSVPDNLNSVTGTVIITSGSVELAPVDLTWVKTVPKKPPPPETATLTNTGSVPLAINGITISGTGAAHFTQTNTCGTSVAAGAACSISVRFSSNGANGSMYAAVLSISDSSSDSPQQINLSGSVHYGLSAAMLDALAQQRVAVVPRPTGGSEVGTRELYLLDSQRTNPYLADGSKRELMVRFWYPAATGTSCSRAEYTSPQTWNYFATLLGVTLPHVSTNSCRNAPVAPGPHPVVVLSHGFTGTSTDYTFLTEDLASRGYVVVSVSHTQEATAVEFPDGRLEKSVLGSHLSNDWRNDADTLSFAVAVRLADLRFVLAELARLNAGQDGNFSGRLDLSRIALAGHSLGGLTTILAMENEPRFKAGVLLDGVMPPHVPSPLRQPVLLLVAGRAGWNQGDCRLWSALRGPRVAINLPGAEHIALSDAVWLLKGVVTTGDAGSDALIAATREYVAGFLDANLKGQAPASLLTGSAPGLAGAVVADSLQSLCPQQ